MNCGCCWLRVAGGGGRLKEGGAGRGEAEAERGVIDETAARAMGGGR